MFQTNFYLAFRRSLARLAACFMPFFAQPRVRMLVRGLAWAGGLLYFAFVLLVLVLRYSVLPNIENYRGDIEQRVSQALGQTVSIGRIEASWAGLNPDLTLLDVRVADAQGRPALAFSRVETVLSWWSVPSLQLRLRQLSIDEPTLHLRRATDGQIFIAGIPLRHAEADDSVSRWVLAQQQIRIRGATLVWEDALRNAPALVLEDVNFGLDNSGHRHRFALTALPPVALAAKLDVRGDFKGDNLDRLPSLEGKLFTEIAYADLAVWRQWIDYPLTLPNGRGALRAWLSFADGAWRDATADLALEDLSLRLASDLPTLDLEHIVGRLSIKRSATGFGVSGHRLELLTRPLKPLEAVAVKNANELDGTAKNALEKTEGAAVATATPVAIRIAPTDFHFDWQPESDTLMAASPQGVRASVAANQLDLDALSALAAYFPLADSARALLKDFSPHGRIDELRASARGTDLAHLQAYSLKARFDELALKAQGGFPGFSRLSGTIEASEQGGSVSLRTRQASIDLPQIFPETMVEFETLNAQAKWKIRKGVLEADLSHADFSGFAGAESTGLAEGTYRYTGEGPGSIDLKAGLAHVDGRAVWRYMPSVVNTTTRHWLRDALLAGTGSEAKLILQGDLSHFPFVDKKQGQFLVTVKAHDVTLDYANGWPQISGIDGDLRFSGPGMTIDVQRAAILGAHVLQTHVEVADLHVAVGALNIKGRVEGPSTEFLKFIAQSPIAGQIGHFTEDIRAVGDGHLELGLSIPLHPEHVHNTKVNGSYRFVSNELSIDPGLPSLRQVNGLLQFSEKDLRIPELSATLLGGPLKVKGGSQPDGRLLVSANGSLSVAQLRKQADWPLFDGLSGTVNYRGEVRVKKGSADLTIDSNLLGLASSLPEPFNKSAGEAMPLHIEKNALPPVMSRGGDPILRDQVQLTLGMPGAPGNAMSMQLIRRKQAEGYLPERGALAIGRPLQLPERGVVFGLSAKRLDLDYWRQALHARGSNGNGGTMLSSSVPPLFTAFNIKAGEVALLGHRLNDVDLGATVATTGVWQMRLASREANGDLQWDGAGRGKLSARLKQLLVDPDAASQGAKNTADTVSGETLQELPAFDIVAEDFVLGARRLGRLELQAHNDGRDSRIWRLDKIVLVSPAGRLAGSGQWQIGNSATPPLSQFDLKLDSKDLGKLLERFGYVGALRGGTAQLDGKIAWRGTPVDLDYASLNGEMQLDAAKGQFLKLDPGAGKLLGLVSLQALPRRITLDFRDIFSEGFAFDNISGKLTVKNGVMRTDHLQIDGPAARVLMHGETDLQNETQRLHVNVQPDLGSSAALGVALLNPLAGVAALLAHKVLQNPLDQIFGFDYLVTGTWDDPKVEKLVRQNAPNTPNTPSQANPPNSSGANNAPAK